MPALAQRRWRLISGTPAEPLRKEVANALISLIGKKEPAHILVKPVLLQPQQ